MQTIKSNFSLLQLSIAFFFLATPLESIPLFDGFSTVKFASIVVIFTWFICDNRTKISDTVRAFVPLTLYALLTFFWSIDADQTLNSILTFLIPSLLITMVIDVSIERKKDIFLYMFFYVFGCLIASIAGLLSRQQTLAQAAYAGQERLSAFGQDQNTLAFFLIISSVPLFKITSITKNNFFRYSTIALLFVFLFMIVSTGSRTGIIAYSITCLIYIISLKKVKTFIMACLLLAICLPVLIQHIPDSIMNRFFTISEQINNGMYSERGIIWSSAFSAFGDENIVLGVGYSNFSTMLKQHFGWQMASHNTYLTYLIEFGILGVGCFVYVLFEIIKAATTIARQERSPYIFCFIVPFFIFMFTLETEYKRWIFIFLVLLNAWKRLNEESHFIKVQLQ